MSELSRSNRASNFAQVKGEIYENTFLEEKEEGKNLNENVKF
jgi:hypothetical protein